MSGRRTRLAATSALAVVAVLLGGCSTGGTQAPPPVAAPASAASLPAADFAAAMARPGTVLLDVRTPAEFAAGHLRGATNLDIGSPGFAAAAAELDKSLTYAVYCRSGSRSRVALAAMAELGFTNSFDLSGGILAWQAAGGEVVVD